LNSILSMFYLKIHKYQKNQIMKHLTTSKLFYGKYPYRIEIRIPNVTFHKLKDTDGLYTVCAYEYNSGLHFGYKLAEHADSLAISRVMKKIINSPNVKLRFEYFSIMIYAETVEMYEKILNMVDKWTASVCVPSNNDELSALISNKNIQIRKSLPFGNFQYKIHVDRKMPVEDRLKFYSWAKKMPDHVKMNDRVLSWLSDPTAKYSWSPYHIYVSSAKYLSIVHIYLGKNIIKIDEIIARSSVINTVSEDEACQEST
jgi:hypothetical protein